MRTMDKSKIYLDLSKCTEEEQKHLEKLAGFKISYIKRYPYLQIIFSGWNQSDCTHLEGKTELTYPEFIKLFEGGEDYPGKQYQPLFDHLNNEHGLILHESEMDEIIRIVGGLNSNQ